MFRVCFGFVIEACCLLAFSFLLRFCCVHTFVGGGSSDAVDIYNSATGAWTTSKLSIARSDHAATSVGNLAIFAGGHTQIADIYNSATGTWTTAQLKSARCCLAATSVGNLAIFAGGYTCA